MYFEPLIGKFCLKGALNSNIQLSHKFSCVNLREIKKKLNLNFLCKKSVNLKPEFKGPMWKQSFLFQFHNGDYHIKQNILAFQSRKSV